MKTITILFTEADLESHDLCVRKLPVRRRQVRVRASPLFRFKFFRYLNLADLKTARAGGAAALTRLPRLSGCAATEELTVY